MRLDLKKNGKKELEIASIDHSLEDALLQKGAKKWGSR